MDSKGRSIQRVHCPVHFTLFLCPKEACATFLSFSRSTFQFISEKQPTRLPSKFYIILGSEFIPSAEIKSVLYLTRAFKLSGIQIWSLMTLINTNMLRNSQLALLGRRKEDNIKTNPQQIIWEHGLH